MAIEKRMIDIDTECPMCCETHIIKVAIDDYIRWQHGELIQKSFPYLSAEEREMIKTGICGKCWDKMFGGSDDEEELDEVEEVEDYADTL